MIRIALRQLVRRTYYRNGRKGEYEYYRGKVHAIDLHYNRALCGRFGGDIKLPNHGYLEPPQIPILDCAKCIAKYEQLRRGTKLRIVKRTSSTMYTPIPAGYNRKVTHETAHKAV